MPKITTLIGGLPTADNEPAAFDTDWLDALADKSVCYDANGDPLFDSDVAVTSTATYANVQDIGTGSFVDVQVGMYIKLSGFTTNDTDWYYVYGKPDSTNLTVYLTGLAGGTITTIEEGIGTIGGIGRADTDTDLEGRLDEVGLFDGATNHITVICNKGEADPILFASQVSLSTVGGALDYRCLLTGGNSTFSIDGTKFWMKADTGYTDANVFEFTGSTYLEIEHYGVDGNDLADYGVYGNVSTSKYCKLFSGEIKDCLITGIRTDGEVERIMGNTIHNCGTYGIDGAVMTAAMVHYNDIYLCGTGIRASYALYMDNNFIHHNGVGLDSYTSLVRAFNNTICNNTSHGISCTAVNRYGFEFINNTLAFNGGYGLLLPIGSSYTDSRVIKTTKNNLSFGNTLGHCSWLADEFSDAEWEAWFEGDQAYDDPKFENAANYDYRTQSGSGCHDNGIGAVDIGCSVRMSIAGGGGGYGKNRLFGNL